MTTKTRLAEIEKRLSPQEVVLAHLDEAMQRYRSVDAWATAVVKGKAEVPINAVADAAGQAAARAMRGQARRAIADAEADAARQAAFLLQLLVDMWADCLSQVETCRLEARLCISQMQVLLLRPPAIDGGDEAAHGCAVQRLRGLIETTIARAHVAQGVIEAIRQGYFAGRPILLADDSRAVEEAVHVAEALVREFNGILPLLCEGAPDVGEDDGHQIDPDAVRREVAPDVHREAVFLARIAQAEAIKLIGEDDGYSLACAAYRDRFAEGAEAPRLGRE